jgi:predicted glycosyltransferase
MRILFTPNATGSGHNMRALSLARALGESAPDVERVVLLDSLQTTFGSLFRQAGVKVQELSDQVVDYSRHSHLTTDMNWSDYIVGYLLPAFLDSGKVLDYIARFGALQPDLVVSDYNTAASAAAAMSGIPHVLVTERYDFSLGQLDDATLVNAGFIVNSPELAKARTALRAVFRWIVKDARLVLTDKPYLPELDDGTPVADALVTGKAHFTGPMVRRPPQQVDRAAVRDRLGLGPGPVVVASVGGTTMFLENKQRLISTYLEAHQLLRAEIPDLELVLLGREELNSAPPGVVALSYLPDWMPLLLSADLLLSAPGWITVTEVATLRISSLFVLADYREYHEIEALQRLQRLGLPTCVGPSAQELADRIRDLLAGLPDAGRGYDALAPRGRGTDEAARLLLNASSRPVGPAAVA